MIKIKVAFVESWLYPANQTNLKSIQKSLDWLEESPLSKKATFVLIM